VLFCGANSILQVTTNHSNPDVNDDMEMFEMLGLTPQNHLQKFLSLLQLKLSSQFTTLGENQNGQDRTYN
jgi:hypothetical protein